VIIILTFTMLHSYYFKMNYLWGLLSQCTYIPRCVNL